MVVLGKDLNDNNQDNEQQIIDQHNSKELNEEINHGIEQDSPMEDNVQKDPDEQKTEEEESTFAKLKKEAYGWARDVVIAIIIVMLIRAFIGEPTNVFGQSMEPTLHENNRLFVSKLNYRFGQPQRQDIIIFHNENEGKVLVKRVIALPGESFEIRNGRVYINGSETPLDEPYVKNEGYIERGYRFNEGTVPEGHIFVMGDNRNDSMDSREIGYISMEDIIGEAIFRFWPLQEVQLIK
jgi:signal peptidase I